ncbi:1996_t:CDS:1, partial [Funneliformis caledonium]
SPRTNDRTNRTPRSTNTRKSKKGRQTLSQIEAISTDLTTDLTAALNANSLPPNFPTSSSESNNNILPEV